MSSSSDFSELDKLATDLGVVHEAAGPFLRAAVEHTAVNVKNAARESVKSGSRDWRAAAAAIGYTTKGSAAEGGSSITAEVGYRKGGGGDLGNLREFGAPGRRLAPHNDLLNALNDNQADLDAGISKALADAEKAGGL